MNSRNALERGRELSLHLLVDSIPAPVARVPPSGQPKPSTNRVSEYFGSMLEVYPATGVPADAVPRRPGYRRLPASHSPTTLSSACDASMVFTVGSKCAAFPCEVPAGES